MRTSLHKSLQKAGGLQETSATGMPYILKNREWPAYLRIFAKHHWLTKAALILSENWTAYPGSLVH
jgi:hypothetical protein